jgi:hypothetical protein
MKPQKLIPILALVTVSALSFPLWAQQVPEQSGGAATPIQPISNQPISSQPSTGGDSGAVPAAHGLFVGYQPADANSGESQLQPDDRPLSGVESVSLGILRSFTTLVDPTFFVTESAYGGESQGWNSTAASVGGGLGLVRDWVHSRIGIQYFGAESFYTPNSRSDASYHTLNFSQTMTVGRWNFLLHDGLTFTPSSGFTSLQAGVVAPASGIGSSSGLQPGLAPSSTIATGQVGTLNNAATAQIAYSFTRRTVITMAGAYGLLYFTGPGYIGSHTASGVFGYNYLLSPMNSIAFNYSYGQNNFSNSSEGLYSHTLTAAFGRKITGKLALSVGGGPQIAEIRNGPGGNSSTTSWSGSASLTYGPRPRNVSYSLSYSHGLTDGSGVLFGSESDTVGGGVHFGFARFWSVSVNGGFVSNRALANTTFGATRYSTWTSGVSLGRPLSRGLLFSVSYLYQNQIQNGVCPVLSCGIFPGSQSVSARLDWHPWPPRLQ